MIVKLNETGDSFCLDCGFVLNLNSNSVRNCNPIFQNLIFHLVREKCTCAAKFRIRGSVIEKLYSIR